jgi:hypothetical protein
VANVGGAMKILIFSWSSHLQRHPDEGRGPVEICLVEKFWISAFAGMTVV